MKCKNMEIVCKHVEKYDFYGYKKQFFSLVRINLFYLFSQRPHS